MMVFYDYRDSIGMTLLETMIALLIFSIGIMGVASMQVCSMYNNAKALRATYDSAAICQRLEAIHSLPFDDPLLSDPDAGYAPSSPDHGPFEVPTTRSTIEWEIDDQFAVPNAKRVSVTVRFNARHGTTKVLTYEYIKIKGVMNVSAR